MADARPTLLVIDPDERFRSALAMGLHQEEFEAVSAASAAEAWRSLLPGRPLPALIFCAVELPDVDGFTFCAGLRRDPRTSDVPVVLLVADAQAWHREAAGGAGADELLCKPVNPDDVATLAILLARRSSVASRYEVDASRLPLHRTLRALLSGVRSGRVELPGGEGFAAFREGALIDASFDETFGEAALGGLMRWARGGYAVVFGAQDGAATMRVDAKGLERWQGLDAVLSVDFARLADVMASLPADAHALLRAVDGRRDVESVLRASAMGSADGLELLTRLRKEGVLVAADASPRAEPPRALDDGLRHQLQAFRGPGNEAVGPGKRAVGPGNEAVGSGKRAVRPGNEAVGPGKRADGPGKRADGPGKEEIGRGSRTGRAVEGNVPAPEEDEDLRALLPPPRSRVPLYVGAGLVVLVAVGLLLSRPSPVAVPEPTPEPLAELEAAPSVAPPVPVAVIEEPLPVAADPQPESAQVLAEGIRHYESGRFRQAVAVLEPAAENDAEAVRAWLYLGLARYDLGERSAAEAAVQRVLAREPRNGRAIMLLATLHLDLGRKEEARAQLRRYLELYPDGPHARDAQRLLR